MIDMGWLAVIGAGLSLGGILVLFSRVRALAARMTVLNEQHDHLGERLIQHHFSIGEIDERVEKLEDPCDCDRAVGPGRLTFTVGDCPPCDYVRSQAGTEEISEDTDA